MHFKLQPLTNATVTMIQNDYKLIYYFGYNGVDDWFELYDLNRDPDELQDLYPTETSVARRLREALLQQLDVVDAPFQ